MKHYYNEIDPVAAQWLRNLIAAGELPPGDVDERSIEDVLPAELDGYLQCHFFAGVGGWPLALRLAGWPADRPIWTGSCPCQPFSAAGKGDGFADERHLWPSFHWLIQQCRPAIVAGEQVASAAVGPWIDLVLTDLEALGYACGAYAGPAAGVSAPHLRDRSYWVGYSGGARSTLGLSAPTRRHEGLAGVTDDAGGQRAGAGPRSSPSGTGCGVAGGMANANGERWTGNERSISRVHQGTDLFGGSGMLADESSSPLHGFWRAADWLLCRDGKWRPVEASPQPLVDGLPESLGRVCAATIAEVEAEVASYAAHRKTSAAEELRNLCEALDAQAQRGWTPGGLPELHSPAFLLAFVCQLATQGWRLAQSLPLSGSQAAGAGMRVLWDNEAAARASRQRGLEGQPARERADALHLLSPVLARHAQTAWGKAYSAYAEIGFPLGHNAPGRVGRLRGYGNAIVPQQAAEFIKAVM